MERTLIKFGCSWRKISRKDAYRGVSESAQLYSIRISPKDSLVLGLIVFQISLPV